jgi:hypothetical protein
MISLNPLRALAATLAGGIFGLQLQPSRQNDAPTAKAPRLW